MHAFLVVLSQTFLVSNEEMDLVIWCNYAVPYFLLCQFHVTSVIVQNHIFSRSGTCYSRPTRTVPIVL
jgi:hypothetical protein